MPRTILSRVGANSGHLLHSAAIRSVTPLTFACWINTTTTGVAQCFMSIGNSASINSRDNWKLAIINTGVIRFQASSSSAATNTDTTASAFANCWQHIAGVAYDDTNRAAFVRGGNKGTSAVSRIPSGPNRTAVCCPPGAIDDFIRGAIAWPCIWSIALSDGEVAKLASGAHPLTVHPEAIVALWELAGRDLEYNSGPYAGAYPLTSSGTPALVIGRGPDCCKQNPRRRLSTQLSGLNRRRRVIVSAAE